MAGAIGVTEAAGSISRAGWRRARGPPARASNFLTPAPFWWRRRSWGASWKVRRSWGSSQDVRKGWSAGRSLAGSVTKFECVALARWLAGSNLVDVVALDAKEGVVVPELDHGVAQRGARRVREPVPGHEQER